MFSIRLKAVLFKPGLISLLQWFLTPRIGKGCHSDLSDQDRQGIEVRLQADVWAPPCARGSVSEAYRPVLHHSDFKERPDLRCRGQDLCGRAPQHSSQRKVGTGLCTICHCFAACLNILIRFLMNMQEYVWQEHKLGGTLNTCTVAFILLVFINIKMVQDIEYQRKSIIYQLLQSKCLSITINLQNMHQSNRRLFHQFLFGLNMMSLWSCRAYSRYWEILNTELFSWDSLGFWLLSCCVTGWRFHTEAISSTTSTLMPSSTLQSSGRQRCTEERNSR